MLTKTDVVVSRPIPNIPSPSKANKRLGKILLAVHPLIIKKINQNRYYQLSHLIYK
jgi:hypothetical protein